MKTKSILSLCGASTNRQSNLMLAASLVAFFGSQSAHGATAAWVTGAVSGAWSNGTNWSATPVPGTAPGETATFAANIVTAFRVIDLGAGVTIRTISFSANGAFYTIGSGAVGSQTLTLEPGGSIAMTSVNGNTPLINANVNLGTGTTALEGCAITNNSNTGGITVAGAVSTIQSGIKTLTVGGTGSSLISGNITDSAVLSAADKVALTKGGGSTLSLNGTNTYSGATLANAGVLSFRKKAAQSTNTSVTVAATGTVALGVKDADASFYSAADVDALFNGTPLAGFTTVDVASGVGIDTSAGNFTYATSLPAVTRALYKVGANTLTLTGTNLYTGQTHIREGTLSVASLATNLSNTQINLGQANTSGTLLYTGTGEDTSRGMQLTGTGTITQAGTGNLKFSSNVIAAAATNKILTLNGATAGTGEIAGVISNGSATDFTGVTKNGTGKWTLSAANLYGRADGTTANGKTTINGGILALGAGGIGGTVGASLAASAVVVNATGTFAVTPGLVTTTNNFIATSGGTTLTMNAGSAFTMADGFINTFNLNGMANLYAGPVGVAPTLNFNVDGGTNTSDTMAISGAVSATQTGALIALTPTTALDVGDTFTIATAASGLDTIGLSLANGGIASFGSTAYSLSLVNTATESKVTVTGVGALSAYYTGDQGTTLNATTGANTNWATDITGTTDAAAQPTSFADVYFSATGATSLTVASLGQDSTFKALNFNNAAGAVTLNNGGSNTLTLNNGINTDTGASLATVNVPVILGAAQSWTNNGQLALSASLTTGGSPLALAGTGSTAISGAISGASALSVNPAATDNGTVTLSGANAYTGGLTLQAGALTLQNDQSSATGNITVGSALSANSTLTIASGASVALASDKTFLIGTTGTGGLTTVAATTSVAGAVSNPGILRVGRLGILNLTSGATWAQSGDMTVQGQGNFTGQMTIGTGASLTYTGANSIKIQPPTGGNYTGISRLTISGTLTTSQRFEAVIDNVGTATGQVLLDNGTIKLSTSIPNLFFADGVGVDATKLVLANTGTIDTNGFDTDIAQIITGAGGLTKDGVGLLALTAANTYTGNTTVNTGTLDIADGAQLRFNTGATSGTGNNLLSGAGTVTLNGDFFINTATTDASALTRGSWQIENAASLPGAYGASFTVVGWTDAGTNTWTKSVGLKNYTFTELDGTVSMVSISDPYTSWAVSFGLENPWLGVNPALNGNPTGDPDGDGINNLLEFVLTGSPVVSSQSINPALTAVGSDQVLSYKRSDASESPATTQVGQWSTDLATWTPVTPVVVSENDTAADDMTITVPNSNAVGGKLFLRLNVVK